MTSADSKDRKRSAAVARVRRHGQILNLGWLVCAAGFLLLGQVGIGVGDSLPTFLAITMWGVGQIVLVMGFRRLRMQIIGWEDLVARNAELNDSLQRTHAWVASTEAAARAKSVFLASMSHEIRTPLTGVLGMTELALASDLSRDQREYLQVIKSSADSLLSIVNDVLDYSRVEAGRLELEDTEFGLDEIIDHVGEIIAPSAAAKGLELVCDLDPSLPDRLRGDPLRIQQILINLAGNAVKFTAEGEIRIEVSCPEIRGKRAEIVCRVVDTGIGIAPQRCKRIFDTFGQAEEDTARHYGGTGLGLTISRQLVELMDGTLTVESAVDEGSAFTATLPLTVAEAAVPFVLPKFFNDRRLLVIDDNAGSRRSLRHNLQYLGFEPTEVDSGRQALALLRRAAASARRYDTILLDLDMPGMDGEEVLAEMRSDPALRSVPVILLAPVDAVGRLAGQTDPVWDTYLVKPVRRTSLLSAMSRTLAPAPTPNSRTTPPCTGVRWTAPPRDATGTILLVDDDRTSCRLAEILLSERGWKVTSVGDCDEAHRLLNARNFDLILLDVNLPGGNGRELAREIRRRNTQSQVPIIALTACALADDRQLCLDAGMDDYIAKPFAGDDLCGAVERALNRPLPL